MNPSLFVNTHNSCNDIWPMFFGQLEKHYEKMGIVYVMTNDTEYKFPSYCNVLYYNTDVSFKEQTEYCLNYVKDSYIIYLMEDYVLYKDVNVYKIEKYTKILEEDNNIDFIKLLRGPEGIFEKYDKEDTLYRIENNSENIYTMQPTIWKTESLKKIYKNGPSLHSGIKGDLYGHFELAGSNICRLLNIQGLFSYNNEPKRGMYHYDSSVFPYIATALIKGKWNLKEYRLELEHLFQKYNIDTKKRDNYL